MEKKSARATYAELVQSVLTRFDGNVLPEGSLREHWQIASSANSINNEYASSDRFKRTMARLVTSGTSSSQTNISRTTQHLLIKQQARGVTTLPGKERYYIGCSFDSSTGKGKGIEEVAYVFVSRSATISDMLEVIY